MTLRIALVPALAFALVPFAAATASAVECTTVAACVLGANLIEGGALATGAGVEGQSYNGYGVLGFSQNYVGLYGYSANSYGVAGVTGGASTPGVYGNAFGSSSNAIGVEGIASAGFGGGFISDSGIGLEVEANSGTAGVFSSNGSGVAIGANGPALILEGGNDSTESLLLGFNGAGGSPVVTIDGQGNEMLQGSLTENSAALVRTHTTSGDVTSYGARSASPTLEDFGTAKLTNGVAYVPLEKTFASTIAPGYMVFVTPHGDSNGLYTQATASGFSVRENKAGRSSLTFDYRIVAKPLDDKGTRLAPMAPMKRIAKPRLSQVRLKRLAPPVR